MTTNDNLQMATFENENTNDDIKSRIRQEMIESDREYARYKKQSQFEGIEPDSNRGNLLKVPISFAIDSIMNSGVQMLKDSDASHLDLSQNKANVISGRLIGPNGSGKTEITMSMAKRRLEEEGYEVITYQKEMGIITKSKDSDKEQVILVYLNASDIERVDIIGSPFKGKIKGEHIDEATGQIVEKDYDILSYTAIQKLKSLSNFDRAVLFIDEANRNDIQNIINGLLNGEDIENFTFPKKGLITFAAMNSEKDGLNDHTSLLDGAAITKAAVFHTYMAFDDWVEYARQIEIHPSVISFAMANKDMMESNLTNAFATHLENEIPFPTFRGLELFSDMLKIEEQANKDLGNHSFNRNQLAAYFQSRLGNVGDADSSSLILAQKFSDFYNETHEGFLKIINDTFSKTSKSDFNYSFEDEKISKILDLMNIDADTMSSSDYTLEMHKLKRDSILSGFNDDKLSLINSIMSEYLINKYISLLKNNQNNIVNIAKGSMLADTYSIEYNNNFIMTQDLKEKLEHDVNNYLLTKNPNYNNNFKLKEKDMLSMLEYKNIGTTESSFNINKMAIELQNFSEYMLKSNVNEHYEYEQAKISGKETKKPESVNHFDVTMKGFTMKFFGLLSNVTKNGSEYGLLLSSIVNNLVIPKHLVMHEMMEKTYARNNMSTLKNMFGATKEEFIKDVYHHYQLDGNNYSKGYLAYNDLKDDLKQDRDGNNVSKEDYDRFIVKTNKILSRAGLNFLSFINDGNSNKINEGEELSTVGLTKKLKKGMNP